MIYVDLYNDDQFDIDWSNDSFESPETNDGYWGKTPIYADLPDPYRCDLHIRNFVKENQICTAKWTNTNFYFVAMEKAQLIDYLNLVYDEKWCESQKAFFTIKIEASEKIKDIVRNLPEGTYILRFDDDS